MAEKETGSKLKFREKLLRALLFIASVAVIVYFLPREVKFRYHFQEGKPWKDGLLTATFAFPVYKSENQITSEQDSVLRQFQPYYKVDKEIYEANINQLRNDYNESLSKILPRHDLIYLEESLKTFYENGIITNNEIKDFQQNNYLAIRVLENNVTKNKPVSMLKTTKQVYEEIIKNAKNEDSQRRLRSSNFNKYIAENLVFDTIVSEKVRKDLLQKISLTSGLVQAGERIVDRGEIITPTTYNILRSLEIVNSKRAATARQKSATLIGQILYVLILMGSIYLFLYLFRNEMFVRLRDLEVIFLMITLMIMFAALFSEFRISSIYMVPLAIVPIDRKSVV